MPLIKSPFRGTLMAFSELYRRQVYLLLTLLPHIAKEDCFALKGGTAINLFIRDMPRLSVDIDLTYLPISSVRRSLCRQDRCGARSPTSPRPLRHPRSTGQRRNRRRVEKRLYCLSPKPQPPHGGNSCADTQASHGRIPAGICRHDDSTRHN